MYLIGPWTATPTTFNNLYYRFLLQIDWKKRDWEGPFQYQDENGRFMMLPTDFVLIKDEKFLKWVQPISIISIFQQPYCIHSYILPLHRYVQMYAADQDKFFADFSIAFAKLENLGTSNLELIEWAWVYRCSNWIVVTVRCFFVPWAEQCKWK